MQSCCTSSSLCLCLPLPGCLNVSFCCWASAEHQGIPSSFSSFPSIDLSQPCVWVNACVVPLWMHMCILWVCLLCVHLFVCVLFTCRCFYLLLFCERVGERVCGRPGILFLVLCALSVSLSFPVPPTCLWHTCVVPSLTLALVNRGKSKTWVIGDLFSVEEVRVISQPRVGNKMGNELGWVPVSLGYEKRELNLYRQCRRERPVEGKWVFKAECEEVKTDSVDTITPVKLIYIPCSSSYLSHSLLFL